MQLPGIPNQTLSAASARSDNTENKFRQKCYNVEDFQRLAKQVLPKDLYEYLASGTDDEQTLVMNRISFQMWYLRPRVLRPVGKISTRVSSQLIVIFRNVSFMLNFGHTLTLIQSFELFESHHRLLYLANW